METNLVRVELQQQYELAKADLLEAVGNTDDRQTLEMLKRKLEKIASEIRKLDANWNYK